jgi:hypothetical protein
MYFQVKFTIKINFYYCFKHSYWFRKFKALYLIKIRFVVELDKTLIRQNLDNMDKSIKSTSRKKRTAQSQ